MPTNFPYRATLPFRETSLIRASWNNLRMYFLSRRTSFAAEYAPTVAKLIRSADHTCFLAGSCGLELFNNLRLDAELEARCTLICYGPVARERPRVARAILVQSSRDYISRAFFRCEQQDLLCGHMGYLSDEAFLRRCRDELSLHATSSCSSTFA